MNAALGKLRRFAVVALATCVLSRLPANATTASGTATVDWKAAPTVHFTLTPNYTTGYGAVKAVFGMQPTPTTGPDASAGAGAVDFGDVLGGTTYLYKYAAHVHVTSNDGSGFYVYGEGAADFYNTADGTTQALNSVLYYLPSTSGSPSDSNTGYSPGLPFYKTSNIVAGNGQFTQPTITYSTYPSPLATSSTNNGDYYYDYEMKVPGAATGGLYYVWIVYTVVPR